MFKFLKPRTSLAALPLLLLLTGCGGGDHPDLYTVSGTVTYNGQPVEGASVQFVKVGSSRSSRATTDAEGHYKLGTYEDGDGAPAGEYVVIVTKREKSTETEDDIDAVLPGNRDDDQSGVDPIASIEPDEEAAEPKSLLPEKYGNPSTTPFQKMSVTAEGPNEFELKLEDE